MSKIKAQAVTPLRQSLLVAAFVIPLIATTLLAISGKASADDTALAPSTDYQPHEVVKIVIDALQYNSAANDHDGIATVYRFASPGNRASTGPLDRFTRMITRGFPDMLNHAGARYDAMEINGESAVQAVWLFTDSGAEVGYAFQLRRQPSGDYEGMWMTDAVVPLGPGPSSGTRI